MNNFRQLLLRLRGINSFGKFFIGLHTKPAPTTETFSNLVDDVPNNLIDDEGNVLQAKD